MRGVHLAVDLAKKRYLVAQRLQIEKLGFESVVEISGVVCNLVHPVDELRFEGRAQIEEVFAKLRKFRGGIVARMLDDALANFKAEIQAGKIEISLFELLDDAQRVQIVIEKAAVRAHQFGELGVQAKRGSNGARDLRDFERVRQPVAEVIGIARGENLRLGFEAPEGSGVNDAVAIARVNAAVGMLSLRVAPPTGVFRAHGPGSRSRNSFDERLRKFPADPRDKLSAKRTQIKTWEKERPG